MRRILFLTALLLVCFAGQAQKKQKKPNIGKAESLRQKGEIAEAKEIIDLAIDYEKTKDNGKTWYYRALIYATIDTTSNEAIAKLSDNPIEIAMEAFAKAEELGDEKSAYYTTSALGIATQDQQLESYYNYYFNKAINAFEAKEYQEAVDQFYKATVIRPADTNAYKNAAYAAHNGELWDQAIAAYELVLDKGATSKDMYTNLILIYQSAMKDDEAALVKVREAREVYPTDTELGRTEIGLLIKLDKIEEAVNNLKNALEEDPENDVLYFNLGAMYEQLEQEKEALDAYNKAVAINPSQFEANFNKGVILLNKANDTYKEYTDLGISKADQKKADLLEPKIKADYKAALPQWEKLWELKPEDRQIGETLGYIYTRLRMYDKVDKIQEALDKLPPAKTSAE